MGEQAVEFEHPFQSHVFMGMFLRTVDRLGNDVPLLPGFQGHKGGKKMS